MRNFADLIRGRFQQACFTAAADDAVYTTTTGISINTRVSITRTAKVEGIVHAGSNFGSRQVNTSQEDQISAALPVNDGVGYAGVPRPKRDETFVVGGVVYTVLHVLETDMMRYLVRVKRENGP